MPKLAVFVACAGLVAAFQPAASAQRSVTTPKAALGHEVGADGFLATYSQLVSYWRTLERESDRLVLETIGKTSYGQDMLMAVISSPYNLAKREGHRATAERLCRARGIGEDQARELAAGGRAVVWIDAGMHATEAVAAQNILELVYRMCARDDAETRRVLDNVILLVCPANPDGMEMIASAYMATRRVGNIPVLYQRYIGHDNNRDFYAINQPETAAISRVFYQRWFPQIIYNHHQSAPSGTIIFTPPFRDPFNYNVDPLVVRGIEIVSAHMNHRFAAEGKPGVISRSGAPYSTWWNGGLRTTTYFHNMIGILTEVFGRPDPTRIEQPLSRRLPYGDYPMPVASQVWHARQTIEYLQTANMAILDYAARYKDELLFNIWQMGRNAILRGSSDHWTPTPKLVAAAREHGEEAFRYPWLRDARAYVVPSDQSDFSAATRFVDTLIKSGVEVHVAEAPFEAFTGRYPAGSWVVRCDQAFRAHVRDMFEPQWHPDDVDAGGEPIRPYDSAGWTLAMQMGVQFDRIRDAFEAPLRRVEGPATMPTGEVTAGGAGWLFRHYDTHSFLATNRLLAQGERVSWLSERTQLAGQAWPAGTVFVARGAKTQERIAALAAELGVDFRGVAEIPGVAMRALKKPRIGLFDVYGGDMETGWTQWALQEFGFPVELVFGKRVTQGGLRADYDVLIFHTGLPRVSLRPRSGRPARADPEAIVKLKAALPPFEDWSTIVDRNVILSRNNAAAALEEFVKEGGTLLALGNQAAVAARLFSLPVRAGTFTTAEDGRRRQTNRSEFFIPGSLVRIETDPSDPLCYGMPRQAVAMFRSSEVFTLEAGENDNGAPASVAVVARYAPDDVLASGWAIGAEHLHGAAAVVRASYGKGRVVLYGPDVMYRGQPLATFKLVFNAILAAAE